MTVEQIETAGVMSDPLEQGDRFDPDTIHWCWDLSDLRTVAEAIENCSEIVFDLETTGLNEHESGSNPEYPVAAKVVLAQFTLPRAAEPLDRRPTTYLVPLYHPESPLIGHWKEALTYLARAMRDSGKPITGQNLKFDLRWTFAHSGVDLSEQYSWDTQTASHLLDETTSTALKPRVAAVFGVPRWDDHDLSGPGAALRVPLLDLGLYGARDTYWTWRWAVAQRTILGVGEEGRYLDPPEDSQEVEERRLGKLATWCSVPSGSALTETEQYGVLLDKEWTRQRLRDTEESAAHEFERLINRYGDSDPAEASLAPTSKWFQEWAGKAVEAGDLRITATTPSGNPQWNKAVLTRQALAGSEVAQSLLRYRANVKQGEYLRSWLALATPESTVHTTYHIGRTVTGRLCISPDSLIEMPRDMTKYPDGVPLRDVQVGDWVYSFDHNMELTLRQVAWVGATKIDRTVIVTFENSAGEQRTLQCTPDHLVRLYNGDWRHAEYLLRNVAEDGTGPRVLSMVRRGWKEPNGNDRYLQFYPHSNSRHTPPSVPAGARYGSKSGGKNTEHRWVMQKILGKKLSTKWDVNHIDGNKVNNHPSNLEYIPASKHRSNTHRDGTRGKEQPGTETYIGPNDFRVISIEEGPVIEVWDMTIPEDHQFIANGIVVHNSSSDPNFQQITHSLKPAFIPRPGFLIAECDYSQIELRVAAFISRCHPMLEAYRTGQDLHRLTASNVAGVPLEDVTKDMRQLAKAVNFGLLYGMGADGLREYAETVYGVSMSEEEAVDARAAFFRSYPELSTWHGAAVRRAQQTEKVVSPIGRVRRLPDIHDGNQFLRGQAERRAINAPVQGFASDLMQIACASIAGRIPGHDPVPQVRLLGTVHDSVVVEVPEDDWKRSTARVMRRMIGVTGVLEKMGCTLDVPLGVESTVSTRWGLGDIGVIV